MKRKINPTTPRAVTSGNIMTYVAECWNIHGDAFDLAYSFDLDEARKAVLDDINHLTPKELSGVEHYIKGWIIPVEAGETAFEAWHRWIDEFCDYPDPDFIDNEEEWHIRG